MPSNAKTRVSLAAERQRASTKATNRTRFIPPSPTERLSSAETSVRTTSRNTRRKAQKTVRLDAFPTDFGVVCFITSFSLISPRAAGPIPNSLSSSLACLSLPLPSSSSLAIAPAPLICSQPDRSFSLSFASSLFSSLWSHRSKHMSSTVYPLIAALRG